MANRRARRELLKRAAAVAAGSWGVVTATRGSNRSAAAPASAPVVSPGLTAYPFGGKVWVRMDGQVFTCYRADPTDKYPYFYPITGPVSGLPMTEEAGPQYPHHRSLFLGCDRVNGGNYWQGELALGRIVSRTPRVQAGGPQRVVIADRCEWCRPDEPAILDDERTFTITAGDTDRRCIDAEITLTARVDVHVQPTNHSFFSLRAAHALTPLGGGSLRNAAGQTGEKDTFGQVADWCGFEGTRRGIAESIVLMDHPANPWSPSKWFTRDYGFISPTPFYWVGDDGWRLPAGRSVTLRYRVLVCGGRLVPEEVDDVRAAWVRSASR